MSRDGAILLIVLLVLLVGGLPHWSYTRDRNWGYYPSTGLGLLLVLVLFLVVLPGRI